MNILITRINFILLITWSLAYSCGQQRNRRDKKRQANWRQFRRPCGCGGAMRGASPLKHNQGFTRSQRMLPFGECSHRIAVVAAMVDDFGRKHKKLFLASQPTVDRSQNQWEFRDPKRAHYSPHRCNKLRKNVKRHDWSWRAHEHF